MYAVNESVCNVLRALRPNILHDQPLSHFRMQTCLDLHNSPAGGVAPKRHTPKAEFANNRFQVLYMILDQIRPLGTPSRIAVPAHVERDHVIVTGELRRDVIKCMGVTGDAMHKDHRRLRG